MSINNLSKRERYLAFVTLSLATIAVVYIFLIAPLYGKWKNLNNQIKSKIGMLEKNSKMLASQKALTSEYSKLSKYSKTSQSEEQAIADTLTYVENISKTDSCFIANIKPVGVTKETSYKKVLIDVTAEGNIGQLSKFLYDAENPRENLINIERFTITSKSGQSGILKGSFLISKILLN